MAISCCNPTTTEILVDIDSLLIGIQETIESGAGTVGTSFATAPDITVLVAGTAVQGLAASTPRGVMVVAHLLNTGSVYIGGPTVSDGSGNAKGITLTQAGMPSVVLPVENLNQIWVNADNAGDRVGVVIL